MFVHRVSPERCRRVCVVVGSHRGGRKVGAEGWAARNTSASVARTTERATRWRGADDIVASLT
eukprot:276157-Prymnesium_polylepis.1